MKTDNTQRISPIKGNLAPAQQAYFTAAVEWLHYSVWTIDEAANLLSGCMPKRQMFQPGESNEITDRQVLEMENRIRRELGNQLEVESSKKYFAPIEIQKSALMEWATSTLDLPQPLELAYEHHLRAEETSNYTTPSLSAIKWTVERYWQNGDLRNPATEGEIIQALMQEFDNLSYDDCVAIERVCRHPVAKSD